MKDVVDIKWGDVFLADLGDSKGSEQGGIRPVVVISNDIGNHYSPTIICAAITSKEDKKNIPTHVSLSRIQYSTPKACIIMCEQIKVLDKNRLIGKKLFSLNDMDSLRLERAITTSLARNVVRENKTIRKYA